jgi:hypothetical protein
MDEIVPETFFGAIQAFGGIQVAWPARLSYSRQRLAGTASHTGSQPGFEGGIQNGDCLCSGSARAINGADPASFSSSPDLGFSAILRAGSKDGGSSADNLASPPQRKEVQARSFPAALDKCGDFHVLNNNMMDQPVAKVPRHNGKITVRVSTFYIHDEVTRIIPQPIMHSLVR